MQDSRWLQVTQRPRMASLFCVTSNMVNTSGVWLTTIRISARTQCDYVIFSAHRRDPKGASSLSNERALFWRPPSTMGANDGTCFTYKQSLCQNSHTLISLWNQVKKSTLININSMSKSSNIKRKLEVHNAKESRTSGGGEQQQRFVFVGENHPGGTIFPTGHICAW